MPIFLIPFSIFFACCVAQFVFVERVKRALADRHPDLLRGMSGRSFFSFTSGAISKFVWQRRDLGLNDSSLTKTVKQFKALLFVAYGAWGLCALAIVTGVASQPLPLDWLIGHAPVPLSPFQPKPISAESNVSATGVSPILGAAFVAALVVNATYLVLAWRLSARWNSQSLGATATAGDTPAVLGVIWWSKPAKRDEAFLRLRSMTRAVFVLAAVGTFTLFGLVILKAG